MSPPGALPLPSHQGASPAEVRQKVNAAAIADAVSDDPEGYGTWNPDGRPTAVDISATPNRLLQSRLAAQASGAGRGWQGESSGWCPPVRKRQGSCTVPGAAGCPTVLCPPSSASAAAPSIFLT